MEPEGPPASTDPRIDELTHRAADDVSALAHEYAGMAKSELAQAGERARWPVATAGIGAWLALVGAGLLLASPAVPSASPRLKRRMRTVALAYLVAGGVAAGIGALAVAMTVRQAMPRTRRGVEVAIDTFREHL